MSNFHRYDPGSDKTAFFTKLESLASPVPLNKSGFSLEELGQLADRGLAYRGHFKNAFNGTFQVQPFFETVPGSLAARFHELAEVGTLDAADAGRFVLDLMRDSDDELRCHWPELF